MENKTLNFQFGSVSTKCAQTTVLEVSKMKQKSSTTDGVHQNGGTEKCEKISTREECLCYHEIQAVKAFHLKFKARRSCITAVLKIFALEFNCVGNNFFEEFFSEIS